MEDLLRLCWMLILSLPPPIRKLTQSLVSPKIQTQIKATPRIMRLLPTKAISEERGLSTLGLHPHGSPPAPKDVLEDHNDSDVDAFKSIAGGGCDGTRGRGTPTQNVKSDLHDMNSKSNIEVEFNGARLEKVRGGMTRTWITTVATLFILLSVCAAGALPGQGHAAGEGKHEKVWEGKLRAALHLESNTLRSHLVVVPNYPRTRTP
jgi:hypothetical protein